MYFSKYNIVTKIKDSDRYFICNLLSKQADILEPEEYAKIEDNSCLADKKFIEKGYVIDKSKEEKLNRAAYLNFIEQRDHSEIQIFYVPTYACNFACSYCYQQEYAPQPLPNATETMNAFFAFVDNRFAGNNKYITIFGGEPLLPGNEQKEQLAYFVNEAKKRSIDLAIVTNGYNLSEYIDIFKDASIREIQVTLDGPQTVHDKRRPLHNGTGTFTEIVEGIDAALNNHIPINLRIVLDRENIEDLPKLARFAIQKGWTSNPLFKTQLGRNYELHHCQKNQDLLFSRLNMYEELYDLILHNPEILKLHKPAYSISRFLFENGDLPDPLFDSCPGCKTEWAFDYTGSIYSCTATVGKKGEEVGTFYPEVQLHEDIIDEWESRDVMEIEQCRDCDAMHLCGGGCGSIAKNQTGSILSPDCRPVKELMGLGISLYFEKGAELSCQKK